MTPHTVTPASCRKPLPARTMIAALLAAALAGCGGSSSKSGGSTSTVQSAGNSYFGIEASFAVGSGTVYQGIWHITVDDQTRAFTYRDLGDGEGYLGLPTIGGTAAPVGTGGFLNITPYSDPRFSTPPGNSLALEIPGEALLMFPGAPQQAPIVAVQNNACIHLAAPATYQFISFGTVDATLNFQPAAYGSVQAAQNGSTWNFSRLQMFGMDGTDLKPAQLPTATCLNSQQGYSISVPASPATQNYVYNAAISPSGFFAMDQGPLASLNAPTSPTSGLGLVGVVQPTAPLDISKMAAATYSGFESDYFNQVGTTPVMFGQTPAQGTVITGVGLGADNITPTSNLSIDLGTQAADHPGLFQNVTVTVPDIHLDCLHTSYGGVDASGNPTCILSGGVAVAGDPNGKFALFITVTDLSSIGFGLDNTPYGVLNFYLYQQ